MILFCDTSALVKLYVREPESEAVLNARRAADTVAVCLVTWAEAHAAFASRARRRPEDAGAIDDARQLLARDWPEYLVLGVTQSLVEQAGIFAEEFALRGYDSVQLAAVYTLRNTTDEPCRFACFDRRLEEAAQALGFPAAAVR